MNKNRKSRHIPLAYRAEDAFKKAVAEALADIDYMEYRSRSCGMARSYGSLHKKSWFEIPRLNMEGF
jgi:hypothetical protein